MDIYEDLKVLLINSSYVDDEEVCGYDEYRFAVRKEYLLGWLNRVADHEITEAAMEDWLRNEYTSDESYLLWQAAKSEGEIIFESPVWGSKITIFAVREIINDGDEREEEQLIYTTNYEEAKEVFLQRADKTEQSVIARQFFIPASGRERLKNTSSKGSLWLVYCNEADQSYALTLDVIKVKNER